jgi:hypothetical protein
MISRRYTNQTSSRRMTKYPEYSRPNPAMAEEKCGVTMTFTERSGWPRWRFRGTVAIAMKQNEVARASRATGSNSFLPKRW